jgi:hypothetical protein
MRVVAVLAVCMSSSVASPVLVPVILDTSSPSFVGSDAFMSMSFGIERMTGDDPFGFFNSTRVTAALAGLAPAYFRVSGTAVDAVLWNETGACTEGVEGVEVGPLRSGRGATGRLAGLSQPHSSPESDSDPHPDLHDDSDPYATCLNASQWRHILSLTNATGLSLVMGVNGRVGKTPEAPNAPWDPSNAQAFLNFTANLLAAEGLSLAPPVGWELGNEPDLWHNFWNTSVNGSTLASDVKAFRKLVASFPALVPGGGNGSVTTFGPDTCNCFHGDNILQEYAGSLPDPLPLPAVHFATFHFYNGGGKDIEPGVMTDPARADTVIPAVLAARQDLVSSGNGAAATMPLVIGETGECVDGGCLGPPVNASSGVGGGPQHPYWSTDYLDGFMFLDKAGLTAALNVSVLMREKVFGGNDGFINALLFPEASYWPMLAHKQLVGPQVLGVVNSTTAGRVVRVYAHCTRKWSGVGGNNRASLGPRVPSYPLGSVTLIVVNLSNDTSAQLQLANSSAPGGGGSAPFPAAPRDEYWFSGAMPAGMPGNDTHCVWGPQDDWVGDGEGGLRKLPYLPSPLCLNGQLLYLGNGPEGANTSLPELVPSSVTDPGQSIVVPPVTYGFVVLPSAGAAACM